MISFSINLHPNANRGIPTAPATIAAGMEGKMRLVQRSFPISVIRVIRASINICEHSVIQAAMKRYYTPNGHKLYKFSGRKG